MNPIPPRRLDLSFLHSRPAQIRVVAATLLMGALGFLWATFATKQYRSTVTVMPAGQQKSGMASLLGSQLGGLAAAFDAGGGADVARIAAVLQSTDVTDAVIEKFELKKRYEQRYQEGARTALWGHCEVKTLTKPSLVQLSCDDEDPKLAQAMLAWFTEYGNQVFRRVSTGSASEEVRFLDRRVAELRRQADEAAGRLREFQEKHQIVDLDSQARALVSSVTTLTGQRMAKKMELDYARRYSTEDEPAARQLASQISVMDEQLRDLEEPRLPASGGKGAGSAGAPARGTGMLPPALAVPRLRAEYEKLYRDRKVAEATLIFALERLESARANEARDVSTFQVLDPPTLPDRHSSPRRGPTTLVLAAIGFCIGVGYEWIRKAG